jgi:hypothetical protein
MGGMAEDVYIAIPACRRVRTRPPPRGPVGSWPGRGCGDAEGDHKTSRLGALCTSSRWPNPAGRPRKPRSLLSIGIRSIAFPHPEFADDDVGLAFVRDLAPHRAVGVTSGGSILRAGGPSPAALVAFLAGYGDRSTASMAWMVASVGILMSGFFWLGFGRVLDLLHQIAQK